MDFGNGNLVINMSNIYPTPTNITGIQGLFSHANIIVGNLFGVGCLVVIYIGSLIILLESRRYRPSDSFALSGLISLTLGYMLQMVGILDPQYLIIILAITLAAGIWAIFDK